MISGNAFSYSLPSSFFPDYSKHPSAAGAKPTIDYQLSYEF